jgi:hypothetical protein
MGSCTSKDDNIVISNSPPLRKNIVSENEMKDKLDQKFKDFPEWEGKIYLC